MEAVVRRELISVIVPVYDEAQSIPVFFKELTRVTTSLGYDFELIFVDDGSTDKSAEAVSNLVDKSKQYLVRLVQLSKNFGKEIAITAGLHSSTGDAAILIDADLQHPIEKIPEFISKWELGAEVVIGVRRTHAHDSTIKHAGSEIFYKIMNKISDITIVPHSTDFRLLDKQVVQAFNQFTEHSRLSRGLIDWLGFKREYVAFSAKKRRFGAASYNLKKLLKLAMDGFTSNSLFPLKMAGYLGIAMTVFFGLLGFGLYIENYILEDPAKLNISGTAMLATLMLFAIGIVLACQGLVAIYIANIHSEVMNRPLYVVRTNKK